MDSFFWMEFEDGGVSILGLCYCSQTHNLRLGEFAAASQII